MDRWIRFAIHFDFEWCYCISNAKADDCSKRSQTLRNGVLYRGEPVANGAIRPLTVRIRPPVELITSPSRQRDWMSQTGIE